MTEYLYAGNIYDTEDKKSCFSQNFSGIEGQSEMVHWSYYGIFRMRFLHRSRIYALYNVLMIGISSPFGSIIRWMFDVNPGLPFVFNIVMFTIGIMLTAGSKDLREGL